MAKVPQNIAVVELRKELIRAINYAVTELEVPAYVIEPIVKELLGEISDQVKREYDQSVQAYNEEIKKEQEIQNQKEEIKSEN